MSWAPPKVRRADQATIRLGVLLLASLLGLQGCGRNSPPQPDSAPRPAGVNQPAAQIVATIGNRSVTAAEADDLVAAQLHELDYQRYMLRRQATEALLLREIAAPGARVRTARIEIVPPLPPAAVLPGVPAGVRPAAASPVTVSVFCNFESAHCASIQATLADVLSLYPGRVRVAERDLPLPIHPRAAAAAEAARCAGQQGRYWAFHDLLWARGLVPERAELDYVAKAIGLDEGSFRKCLDGRAEANAVDADLELARRLGIGAVPAVFVNGRPAAAQPTPDNLVWLIEEELKRANTGSGNVTAAKPTRLPLALRATITGTMPGLGLAVIGGQQQEGQFSIAREGERVSPEAILRRVHPDGVELLVAGRIETLSLQSSTVQRGESAGEAGQSGDTNAAPPTAPPRTSVMPVFLDREMVRERMADRVALSAHLKPVAMTVDGYRLLQLGDVPAGSLYELLGLQAGDVIVAVNERPIHEGDNPLWDALDREQEVRVRVMRRGGLAQHYTYRFD